MIQRGLRTLRAIPACLLTLALIAMIAAAGSPLRAQAAEGRPVLTGSTAFDKAGSSTAASTESTTTTATTTASKPTAEWQVIAERILSGTTVTMDDVKRCVAGLERLSASELAGYDDVVNAVADILCQTENSRIAGEPALISAVERMYVQVNSAVSKPALTADCDSITHASIDGAALSQPSDGSRPLQVKITEQSGTAAKLSADVFKNMISPEHTSIGTPVSLEIQLVESGTQTSVQPKCPLVVTLSLPAGYSQGDGITVVHTHGNSSYMVNSIINDDDTFSFVLTGLSVITFGLTEGTDAPAYVVSIPARIDIGTASFYQSTLEHQFSVQLIEAEARANCTISVLVESDFQMRCGSSSIPFSLFSSVSAVYDGELFCQFVSNGTGSFPTTSATGMISVDMDDIKVAGDYTGTLVFSMSYSLD